VFGDFLFYFRISSKFCHLNSNQKNPNFAIWKKKSLPTNGLICQQVCDVGKLAMIDLVEFGYKLNMDVILWNLPLIFGYLL